METQKSLEERLDRMNRQANAGQPINPADVAAVASVLVKLTKWAALTQEMCNGLHEANRHAIGCFEGIQESFNALNERMMNLEERMGDQEDFTEDMSEDLNDVEEILGLTDEEEEEYDYELHEAVLDDGTSAEVLFLHYTDFEEMDEESFRLFIEEFQAENDADYFGCMVTDIRRLENLSDEEFGVELDKAAQFVVDAFKPVESEDAE